MTVLLLLKALKRWQEKVGNTGAASTHLHFMSTNIASIIQGWHDAVALILFIVTSLTLSWFRLLLPVMLICAASRIVVLRFISIANVLKFSGLEFLLQGSACCAVAEVSGECVLNIQLDVSFFLIWGVHFLLSRIHRIDILPDGKYLPAFQRLPCHLN